MILQTLIPENENFELPVTLPKSYLGKKVYCLFFIEEEAQNIPLSTSSTKKPSDFFGVLNEHEGDKFENQIKKFRNEWDRNG
jgi:hypothetical protein